MSTRNSSAAGRGSSFGVLKNAKGAASSAEPRSGQRDAGRLKQQPAEPVLARAEEKAPVRMQQSRAHG